MKSKLIILFFVIFLLCGCQEELPVETVETTVPPVTVGLCLPGRGTDWREQANRIATALEAEGVQVRLEYGSDDVLLQQSQVQGLVHMPVDLLILDACDSPTLGEMLEGTSFPVLAYDRMLQFSDAVDGFVTANYFDAGQQLATFALETYNLENRTKPLTAELLMGQPQDPNAYRFYEGIMSVLQPYLDSGKVICRSGRLRFEDVCLTDGDLEEGRDISFDYLGLEYEHTFPDIFFCGSDAIADGCTQALEGMAFSPTESWPVVTGLGGTEDGLHLLEEGYMTATAVIDQEALAAECVRWALALLEGQPLPEHTLQSNGVSDIPTSAQKMQLLTAG